MNNRFWRKLWHKSPLTSTPPPRKTSCQLHICGSILYFKIYVVVFPYFFHLLNHTFSPKSSKIEPFFSLNLGINRLADTLYPIVGLHIRWRSGPETDQMTMKRELTRRHLSPDMTESGLFAILSVKNNLILFIYFGTLILSILWVIMFGYLIPGDKKTLWI